jgi:uncharacterized protein
MTAENIEVVRRVYESWSRGDVPGPVELLDPDVEYVNPGGAIEPGTRRGIAEFTGAVGKTLEAWEHWRVEPQRVEAVGDQVVAVVRYQARGRGSGIEIEGTESSLWTLRDGKVIRYEWFHGPEDAFEAVR